MSARKNIIKHKIPIISLLNFKQFVDKIKRKGCDFINRKIRTKESFGVIVGLFAIVILFLICFIYRRNNVDFDSTDVAMGSLVTQSIECESPSKVCAETMDLIKELEHKISWRIEDSEITKINCAKENEPIKVSEDTLKLLDISFEISKLSENAFNPAILPLSKLWTFAQKEQKIPIQDKIAKVLPHINCSSFKIDRKNNSIMKKDAKAMLDLGSVGKGAACDVAVENYRKNKVKSGIISVGGTIGTFGKKNEKWEIAIRNPFESEKTSIFAIVNIISGYVSTSGSYEKNFTYKNTLYHHVLSSETGYPIETEWVSVTVHQANGTIADILSTVCFILGPQKSKFLLNKFNAQAIFVNKNRQVIASSNLKSNLKITDSNFSLINMI